MADMRDIIKFSCNGESIFGIVIEHYANPLDEFSIVYADYSLHKVYNIEEDAIMMIDNIIIPACDNALTDFRLRRQHLKDIGKFCDEIEFMKEAMQSKLKTDDLFDDVEPLRAFYLLTPRGSSEPPRFLISSKNRNHHHLPICYVGDENISWA